jgi:hypothetical protein
LGGIDGALAGMIEAAAEPLFEAGMPGDGPGAAKVSADDIRGGMEFVERPRNVGGGE